MSKKKKKNKSGAVQQMAPPSAAQAAAASAAAASETTAPVAAAPAPVAAAPAPVAAPVPETPEIKNEKSGESSVKSEDTNNEQHWEGGDNFRGRGRGFMRGRFMRGGPGMPHPRMMMMMRGRPGFRPPPPHMMRGHPMFGPRGPPPPGFRGGPMMRPGFRGGQHMRGGPHMGGGPPMRGGPAMRGGQGFDRGRGGYHHHGHHEDNFEFDDSSYDESNDSETATSSQNKSTVSTTVTSTPVAITTSTIASSSTTSKPAAQPYKQFEPRTRPPFQRPQFQHQSRPTRPTSSFQNQQPLRMHNTSRFTSPRPAVSHTNSRLPPPRLSLNNANNAPLGIRSATPTLTSLPPPGLPPPAVLRPPSHTLPPPTNQPPPALIHQQPPFGLSIPSVPPPMSAPPPLGQPPPGIRLTAGHMPSHLILSTGQLAHQTLLPPPHSVPGSVQLMHQPNQLITQLAATGAPPPNMLQPTVSLIQPQLSTLPPLGHHQQALHLQAASAHHPQLAAQSAVVPPPNHHVATGAHHVAAGAHHAGAGAHHVAAAGHHVVAGAPPNHHHLAAGAPPSHVVASPGSLMQGALPPSAAHVVAATPTLQAVRAPIHQPVATDLQQPVTHRSSARGGSDSRSTSSVQQPSRSSSGRGDVSPTAKEALKFIYSCKSTDQMSSLPTCIFCSEPHHQSAMNDHLYSRHWHKLFVCLVVRSAGNRCKHAFLYVNELTDHITEFHGIAEVDVNKCVNDNQIQLPENLKLFICKLCPSGKSGVHLEHKDLIYNHITKKHPEVKCTFDNIIRFECRACHKFDFQNYDNLLSHIDRRHASRRASGSAVAQRPETVGSAGSSSRSAYYHEQSARGGVSRGQPSRDTTSSSRKDDYQDYDRSRKRRYEDDRHDDRYKQPRTDREYADHRRSSSGVGSSAGPVGAGGSSSSHHETSSRYQERGNVGGSGSRDDYRRQPPQIAAVGGHHHGVLHHHHQDANKSNAPAAVSGGPAVAPHIAAVSEPISDTLDLDEAFLVRTRKDGGAGGRKPHTDDGGIVILK